MQLKDVKDFQAGRWIQRLEYNSFSPSEISLQWMVTNPELVIELYKQPILDGGQVAELLEIHPSTANRLIRDFQQIGILKELTGYKRNRIYAFEEYIKLFS